MKGRKLFSLALALILVAMLTACAKAPTETTQPPEAALASLEALLGQNDKEAAESLGGGQENWTADKSFFIGRIYQTTLFDAPVTVYTSYGNDQTVNSVSAWLTDGTQAVADDKVQAWVDDVSGYTGSEPDYDETSSEGGSRNWKWKKGDVLITLRWLGDVVTVDLQHAVGELK